MGKMNKKLKKLMGIGLGTYIAAYAGLASYAILDYKKNQDKIFNGAPNLLIVKEYSAEINGKEKKLALVGENHHYTDKESKYASEIMEKYENIAIEGSDKEIKSKKFAKLASYFNYLSGNFYITGSGRIALNSNFLSAIYTKANGKKRFCLEDKNPLDGLNNTQKARFLAMSAISVLFAPKEYFEGKDERNISLEEYKKITDEERNNQPLYCNSDEREAKMAKNIEDILNREDIDSLACFIGASHQNIIESKLKKKIEIKPAE